eukprot:TRINITY_DN8146_c0_g1_i6.p1 TRINITY_DN8146_c0_g1~~TRINITY_DN8146_c0_g1_i6.p1  ORF type:complete len:157 (+),score=37.98 TRINITY_DN8146_c0_g1_i6:153-623(+)
MSITGYESKAVTVKDVPPQDFIRHYAEYLKKNNKLEVPNWVDIVKTGHLKELAPYDQDWLYIRTAALARKVYLRGHLGVGTLRHIYGGRKNMGTCKERHAPASGKVIRYCLQQLEKLGIVKRDKQSILKKLSRKVTADGQRDLDRIAGQVAKAARE